MCVWEGDQELKEHRGCCICGVVLSTVVVERYLARYVAGNKAFKVCKEYLFTSSTASTSSCLTVRETVEGSEERQAEQLCMCV